MSANVEDKVKRVSEVLPDGEAAAAAADIVRGLARLTSQEMSLLSYNSLAGIIGWSSEKSELLRSVAALTSPELNVLAVLFIYVGLDDQSHLLSPADVSSARRNGYIVDPNTGAIDNEFDRRMYPYFRATDEFKALLGSE
jgi:hypothetical protein